MIIPGRTVLSRQIVCGILSSKHQRQPCGIDLSLKRVLGWKSAGVVDFDNVYRKTSATAEIPFQKKLHQHVPSVSQNEDSQESLHLAPGAYLIEFNETVDTPLDVMGQLFVRSSLFRSGALVSAGVMDAGYQGAIGELTILLYQTYVTSLSHHKGALLQVVNPFGLTMYKNAKLAQFVFHELKDKVCIVMLFLSSRVGLPVSCDIMSDVLSQVDGYSGVYQHKKEM